ncbi:MAG: DUF6989 domain-containing protein [Sinimarinibacterium flocculans]|uniref:DUF6989 domain-containing protein n=1 Tax=Sinimarinibacterium flocculans TaxID=985250 RepID=UPI003C67FCA0
MHRHLREALLFHTAFFVAAAAAIALTPMRAFGSVLLMAAVAYQIALPAWSLMRGHGDWLALWAFLLPLSLCQPLADWVLVDVAQTLTFPDHGIYRIGGAVPLYFCGLWTMALFPVLLAAQHSRRPWLAVTGAGLLVFAACEWIARPLGLWHARNVATVAGVAAYVLVAEVLLCWAALAAYRGTRGSALPVRVVAAAGVSLLYTGALLWALLVVDPLFSRG